MIFYSRNCTFLMLAFIANLCHGLLYSEQELIIVGGGIAGAIEAYYAYCDAQQSNSLLIIKIYEKNNSISETTTSNIVPSLTPDEILSVVPRGQELVKKLGIPFNEPGGIRVNDVDGINESIVTEQFKSEVQQYSLDEAGHNQRTQALLDLGRMSMDLWSDMYNNADTELKEIFESSNFNPCRQPLHAYDKTLHDGYRIDLIYNVPNARERAENMRHDYDSLGYKDCTILSPNEVLKIDPFLADFCANHSANNTWNNDTVALWRPGGCIDAQTFLPKFYDYLKNKMGRYTNEKGSQEDRFQIQFGKKVTGIEFAKNSDGKSIVAGLTFEDGSVVHNNGQSQYVFCPGEAVGTLKKLGLSEPAYAGFAGVSLLLNIDIPDDKINEVKSFGHCMEVHQEGVVLAWQARFKNNKIFIGVAGTKAFYADQQPTKDQEFARNRNLLQLNMINDVLPKFISLALKRNTAGQRLTETDLKELELREIATRWAGLRSVVYDGFPTLGYAHKDGEIIENARCTTHLGSGGGSFSPATVIISRNVLTANQDEFTQKILDYGSSARTTLSLN